VKLVSHAERPELEQRRDEGIYVDPNVWMHHRI